MVVLASVVVVGGWGRDAAMAVSSARPVVRALVSAAAIDSGVVVGVNAGADADRCGDLVLVIVGGFVGVVVIVLVVVGSGLALLADATILSQSMSTGAKWLW